MAERLQKRIAASGLMSRRAAEEAIREGRVAVNGITAGLGDRAEDTDLVTLDGTPLPDAEEKQYILLYKPRGYVCSMCDERGRRSVRELLPESFGRVYPVGRLDIMSEGLLLMTNDGDFARFMMHPSNAIRKTYRTTVRGEALEEGIAKLRQPLEIDGAFVQADQVRLLKKSDERAVLDIVIHEGKNRQIRRMCEAAGLRVLRLVRVREGSFVLDGLTSGKYRVLSQKEVQAARGADRE